MYFLGGPGLGYKTRDPRLTQSRIRGSHQGESDGTAAGLGCGRHGCYRWHSDPPSLPETNLDVQTWGGSRWPLGWRRITCQTGLLLSCMESWLQNSLWPRKMSNDMLNLQSCQAPAQRTRQSANPRLHLQSQPRPQGYPRVRPDKWPLATGCKMCKIFAHFPAWYHGKVAPGYHGIFSYMAVYGFVHSLCFSAVHALEAV